jgi:hypothetical protein
VTGSFIGVTMPEISISEAAKRAGISRQKLYENYINKGRISVSKNAKGRPCIDTSEILRVFGELKNIDTHTDKVTQSYSLKTRLITPVF